MPGCEPTGFTRSKGTVIGFDHVTSNFETMAGAVLFLEHVMGFTRFWGIDIHTGEEEHAHDGSGLRSTVLWDPVSRVKFAMNEPRRPNFKQSQVNVFAEQMRGPGIQHVALAVEGIVPLVTALRARGVQFIPTAPAYYDRLPTRLGAIGVGG